MQVDDVSVSDEGDEYFPDNLEDFSMIQSETPLIDEDIIDMNTDSMSPAQHIIAENVDEICGVRNAVDNITDSSGSGVLSAFFDDVRNSTPNNNNSFLSRETSPTRSASDEDGINLFVPRPISRDYGKKSRAEILLAQWAVQRKITQGAGSQLLHILKDPTVDLLDLANLPLSLQTLKKIPKSKVPSSPEIKNLCGGEYAYLGIENNLNCSKAYFYDREEEVINLAFNTDGVDVIESSPACFWPILSQCHGCRVFLIALYYGNTKPNNFNDFFHDFVEETKYLKKKYGSKFQVYFFTADTQAKAPSLNIKGPVGYFSCPKCKIPGKRSFKEVENDNEEVMTRKSKQNDKEVKNNKKQKTKKKKIIKSNIHFADKKYKRRKRADYYNVSNEVKTKGEDPKLIFHHGVTKLREIPDFDPVKDVVIDIQHAAYINTLEKLVEYYIKGYCVFSGKSSRRRSLLGAKNVQLLSTELENLKKWCPSEFARKPRKLSMLSDWKSTEDRQFLEYTGLVLLKKYLPEKQYTCFKALALAMRLVNAEEGITEERMRHAEALIEYFFELCTELYGPEFITHSIHILRHLPEDCLRFQTTAIALSCLAFENFNFELSSSIQTGYNALQQMINRYNENVFWSKYEKIGGDWKYNNEEDVESETLRVGNYIFRSDREGDSFCSINSDNRFFQIISFRGNTVKGKEFEKIESFFPNPDDSRYYGYYKCRNLSSVISSFNAENISGKFYPIPTRKKDAFVLVKLQHAL